MRHLRRRGLLTAVAALVVLSVGMPVPATAGPVSPAATFTNPIAQQRADPHIYKHTDGFYYYTATVPAYDRIVLRRATTLQGLATAPESTIIDGKWYVYFAAASSSDPWAIRPYVLESGAADPRTGAWSEKGRIDLPLDTFSLDATTFLHNGTRYLSWAQNDPAVGTGTSIYLARMSNPWTISGDPVRIATPTYAWETVGHRVNEGPAFISKGGKVFMSFSASATDSNYCLGLLTADGAADLMNPASWSKESTPVFTSNAATGQYGPGHNSFTVSEDGRSDILVYHARTYRDISGDPLNDPNRHTRVQKLYWNSDGTPNFGVPVPEGPTPVRLSSLNFPDRYIRHAGFRAKVEANVADLADSQFRIVGGLAGSGSVSLESVNFPGYYLRHKGFELWLEKNDGSALFAGDASFHRRAGLADAATGLSFESYNYPGRYIRHYDSLLQVQQVATTLDRADATYFAE